jgi:hypothetical protein
MTMLAAEPNYRDYRPKHHLQVQAEGRHLVIFAAQKMTGHSSRSTDSISYRVK